tara:strand:+ start:95 stop:571 length:477 start_codon:yes stop_codon:yes gene_type:complete
MIDLSDSPGRICEDCIDKLKCCERKKVKNYKDPEHEELLTEFKESAMKYIDEDVCRCAVCFQAGMQESLTKYCHDRVDNFKANNNYEFTACIKFKLVKVGDKNKLIALAFLSTFISRNDKGVDPLLNGTGYTRNDLPEFDFDSDMKVAFEAWSKSIEG